MTKDDLKDRVAHIDLWGDTYAQITSASEALAIARWLKAWSLWKRGKAPKPRSRVGQKVKLRCTAE